MHTVRMNFDLNNETTAYQHFKAHKEINKSLTTHKILITGYLRNTY